ncbi:emerin [Tachyglossus aculeatus]|uniref:emerin n=1 Tax=Tachyglossus aculeatus TaxID=9261 RepID=UPI0018F35F6F|nr:emerin [Tachyglossus aculeatus]
MEDYKGLSDSDLISMLKQYNIPHGPIVGSTRKLYEKKIYEYETQRTKLSPQKTSSSSYSYRYSDPDSRKTYSPPEREESNRHRAAFEDDDLDSGSYDFPRREERLAYRDNDYDDYYEESYSSTKTYGEPEVVASASRSYGEPLMARTFSETSTARNYSESEEEPTVRQRVRDDILFSPTREENKDRDRSYYPRGNAYQSVSHYRPPGSAAAAFSSSGPPGPSAYSTYSASSASSSSAASSLAGARSSLHVEARRAIRPERQGGAEGELGGRRFVPLWLQLLLFLVFAGFLAFMYYFVQAEDDNPFRVQH